MEEKGGRNKHDFQPQWEPEESHWHKRRGSHTRDEERRGQQQYNVRVLKSERNDEFHTSHESRPVPKPVDSPDENQETNYPVVPHSPDSVEPLSPLVTVPHVRNYPKKIMMRDLAEKSSEGGRGSQGGNKMGDGSGSGDKNNLDPSQGFSKPKVAWSPVVTSLPLETSEPEAVLEPQNPISIESWNMNERGPIMTPKTLYEPEGRTSQEKFRKYQRSVSGGGGGGGGGGGTKPRTSSGSSKGDQSKPDKLLSKTGLSTSQDDDDTVFVDEGLVQRTESKTDETVDNKQMKEEDVHHERKHETYEMQGPKGQPDRRNPPNRQNSGGGERWRGNRREQESYRREKLDDRDRWRDYEYGPTVRTGGYREWNEDKRSEPGNRRKGTMRDEPSRHPRNVKPTNSKGSGNSRTTGNKPHPLHSKQTDSFIAEKFRNVDETNLDTRPPEHNDMVNEQEFKQVQGQDPKPINTCRSDQKRDISNSEYKHVPDRRTDSKSNRKTDPKPDHRTELKSDRIDLKSDHRTGPKSDHRTDPIPALQTDSKSDRTASRFERKTGPKSDPDPQSNHRTDSKSDRRTGPHSDNQTDSKSDHRTDHKHDQRTDTKNRKTDHKPDHKTDPKSDQRTDFNSDRRQSYKSNHRPVPRLDRELPVHRPGPKYDDQSDPKLEVRSSNRNDPSSQRIPQQTETNTKDQHSSFNRTNPTPEQRPNPKPPRPDPKSSYRTDSLSDQKSNPNSSDNPTNRNPKSKTSQRQYLNPQGRQEHNLELEQNYEHTTRESDSVSKQKQHGGKSFDPSLKREYQDFPSGRHLSQEDDNEMRQGRAGDRRRDHFDDKWGRRRQEGFRDINERGFSRGRGVRRGRGSYDNHSDYYQDYSSSELHRYPKDTVYSNSGVYPSRTFDRGKRGGSSRSRGGRGRGGNRGGNKPSSHYYEEIDSPSDWDDDDEEYDHGRRERGRGRNNRSRGGKRGGGKPSGHVYHDLDDIDSPPDWDDDELEDDLSTSNQHEGKKVTHYEYETGQERGRYRGEDRGYIRRDQRGDRNRESGRGRGHITRRGGVGRRFHGDNDQDDTGTNEKKSLDPLVNNKSSSSSSNIEDMSMDDKKVEHTSEKPFPQGIEPSKTHCIEKYDINAYNVVVVDRQLTDDEWKEDERGGVSPSATDDGFITVMSRKDKQKDREEKRKQGVEQRKNDGESLRHKGILGRSWDQRGDGHTHGGKGWGSTNPPPNKSESWSRGGTETWPISTISEGGGAYGAIGDKPSKDRPSSSHSSSLTQNITREKDYKLFDSHPSNTPPFPLNASPLGSTRTGDRLQAALDYNYTISFPTTQVTATETEAPDPLNQILMTNQPTLVVPVMNPPKLKTKNDIIEKEDSPQLSSSKDLMSTMSGTKELDHKSGGIRKTKVLS